jgi:hypothetical protein
MNSLSFYEVEVSTWCVFRKGMVTLTLRSVEPFKSDVVKGKPVHCSYENQCRSRSKARCYLKAVQIETKR